MTLIRRYILLAGLSIVVSNLTLADVATKTPIAAEIPHSQSKSIPYKARLHYGIASSYRRPYDIKKVTLEPKSIDQALRNKLRAKLNQYAQKLLKTYSEGDYREYDRVNAELMWYTSQIPVYQLASFHHEFIGLIDQNGVGPFLSLYIDYGIRLGNIASKSSREKYDELVAHFNFKKLKSPSAITTKKIKLGFLERLFASKSRPRKEYIGPSVLLRNADRKSFSKYSENVGKAVAMLIFSNFGTQYSNVGVLTADKYLDIVTLIDSCNEKESDSSGSDNAVSSTSIATCEFLLSKLDQLFPTSSNGLGNGDLNNALASLKAPGFTAMTKGCLAGLADSQFTELVNRLEDYMACRNQSNANMAPDFGQIMQLIAYGVTGEDFQRIQTDDGDNVGSVWTNTLDDGSTTQLTHIDGLINQNGDAGTYFDEVTTDADGKVTSANYSWHGQDAEGNDYSQSGSITVDPNTGQKTESHSTEMSGVGSVTSTTVTDSDGNQVSKTTSITIEFSDGSSTTWTTTVDEDGNVTTTETSTPAGGGESGGAGETATGRPIDETIVDQCANILNPDPRTESGNTVTKLETQIIPAVDSAPTDTELTACLSNRTGGLSRCTSVFLCLEGSVNENCNCTSSSAGENLPPARGNVCQMMTCVDGAVCDPTTGTCRTSGMSGGGFEPPLPIPVDEKLQRLLGPEPYFMDPTARYELTNKMIRELVDRRNQEIERRKP